MGDNSRSAVMLASAGQQEHTCPRWPVRWSSPWLRWSVCPRCRSDVRSGGPPRAATATSRSRPHCQPQHTAQRGVFSSTLSLATTGSQLNARESARKQASTCAHSVLGSACRCFRSSPYISRMADTHSSSWPEMKITWRPTHECHDDMIGNAKEAIENQSRTQEVLYCSIQKCIITSTVRRMSHLS